MRNNNNKHEKIEIYDKNFQFSACLFRFVGRQHNFQCGQDNYGALLFIYCFRSPYKFTKIIIYPSTNEKFDDEWFAANRLIQYKLFCVVVVAVCRVVNGLRGSQSKLGTNTEYTFGKSKIK